MAAPEETHMSRRHTTTTEDTKAAPLQAQHNTGKSNIATTEQPTGQPPTTMYPSWSEDVRTETPQPTPETAPVHQPQAATQQLNAQCRDGKPDPYQTISELTLRVQQLQMEQDQLKATSVLRPHPTTHTQDTMATNYPQPARVAPAQQQPFQQYVPKRPTAHPDDESRYSRRNEYFPRTRGTS